MTDCILCGELRPVGKSMRVCGQCAPAPQKVVVRAGYDYDAKSHKTWVPTYRVLMLAQGKETEVHVAGSYWDAVRYCNAHGLEIVW